MKFKRAAEGRDHFQWRLREIEKEVHTRHLTSQEMSSRLITEIWTNPDYQNLPQWVKYEIIGYADAISDVTYDRMEQRWRDPATGLLLLREQVKPGGWANVTYAGAYHAGTEKPFFSA